MSHFYEVMEHVSPIMAWGLLGPDRTFGAKITLVKARSFSRAATGIG